MGAGGGDILIFIYIVVQWIIISWPYLIESGQTRNDTVSSSLNISSGTFVLNDGEWVGEVGGGVNIITIAKGHHSQEQSYTHNIQM